MTEEISTADEKKLHAFFDDKTQQNLEALDDWMLAGLVLWQEVNDDQKNWIIDKLPNEPREMFTKYWKGYRISESSITFKEIRTPYIQAAVMASGCRGSHPWPNKLMKKGDLRLSIKIPNPRDPYFGNRINWVKHYFCASCAASCIDFKERYSLIKDWWGIASEAEKEKLDKENARKKDPARVHMELSKAEGTSVPKEFLPTILGFYMWDDDKNVRATAKSVFLKNETAKITETVKKYWNYKYRETASETWMNSEERIQYINQIKPLIRAFKTENDYARITMKPQIDIITEFLECEEDVSIQGINQSIWIVGELKHPCVVELLIKLLDNKFSRSWIYEDTVKALGKIGDKRAIKPLITKLKHERWNVRNKTAWALDKLQWKPPNDKLQVRYLIAKLKRENRGIQRNGTISCDKTKNKEEIKNIVKCEIGITSLIQELEDEDWIASILVKIGEPAVEPLIENIGKRFDYDYTLGSSVDPIFSILGVIGGNKALETLIEKAENNNKYAITALGNNGDKRSVKTLMKLLELQAKKKKTDAHCYEIISSLERIGYRNATKALIQIIKNCEDYPLRAIEALGKIGTIDAIEPLIQLCDLRTPIDATRWGPRAEPRFQEGESARCYRAWDALEKLKERRVITKKSLIPVLKMTLETKNDYEITTYKGSRRVTTEIGEYLHLYVIENCANDESSIQILTTYLNNPHNNRTFKAAIKAIKSLGKEGMDALIMSNRGYELTIKEIREILKGSNLNTKEKNNIIKFLKSKDDIKNVGAAMLKGILNE